VHIILRLSITVTMTAAMAKADKASGKYKAPDA
jgi:hypothetical protein